MDKEELLQSLAQKEVDKHGSQLDFIPVAWEDLSADQENVEWVWEGYLAKGHKTLFSAKWKAGKTSLITNLLEAITKGEPFLDLKIKKCNVLVITEETELIWKQRREDYEIEGKTGIYFINKPFLKKANFNEWVQLLESSAKFCKENKVDLVIVDTLTDLWPVKDENNASLVSEALIPFNHLTNNNISVLVVHHFAKAEGSTGNASRGSGHMSAAHDILMDFKKPVGDEHTRQREINSLSRFSETPESLVIYYDDNDLIYKRLGTKSEVSKDQNKNRLLQVLPTYPEFWSRSVIEERWRQKFKKEFPVPHKNTMNSQLRELQSLELVMEDPESLDINYRSVNGKVKRWAKRPNIINPYLDPPSYSLPVSTPGENTIGRLDGNDQTDTEHVGRSEFGQNISNSISDPSITDSEYEGGSIPESLNGSVTDEAIKAFTSPTEKTTIENLKGVSADEMERRQAEKDARRVEELYQKGGDK